jgi:hypothetical protein
MAINQINQIHLPSLEAGKTYVIQVPGRLRQGDMERMQAYLDRVAPECKFLILDGGMEIAGLPSIPDGPIQA